MGLDGNKQQLQPKEKKNMGTILIVILILVLVGALPTWPHSKSWGYYPQRWNWIGSSDFNHPGADGADLK